ncbi:MAG: hypothetical protein LBE59_05460 [Nevskiaceae bacterium]|jgi:Tfp pilus assembly protein PilX|nr:hypothetical protein [Nevskiaceae bacterium]
MKSRNASQRGISLVVVLVALLIMALAAAAMLRSTDTATLIAGNLGFKKTAQSSGDAGTEAAIKWFNGFASNADLWADAPANGYWASIQDGCDLTGQRTPNNPADDVTWDVDGSVAAACPMKAVSAGSTGVAEGYTVTYVINRVCNTPGNPEISTVACSQQGRGDRGDSTRGIPGAGETPLSGASQIYFRITTRISGPRDTVRFIQAFVVF